MRPRHPLAWLAALLAVVGVSALAAFATVLYTDWGHRRVVAYLNSAVSDNIQGKLEVAHIEALSLGRLIARGVKISPPSGPPAIVADRAIIDFSLASMWHGTYGWSHADVSGCLVRVTEDASKKTNMERTFAAKKKPGEHASGPDDSEVDMQNMVTHGCTLLIDGGVLPELRLTKLDGIMRVHVLKNGDTELTFDRYAGVIEKGVPMGELSFHDVQGTVNTAGNRLLRFDGAGNIKRTPLDFELEVVKDGKKRVRIDAAFPDPTLGSLSTLWVALWSKVSPDLEIDVHYGKDAAAKLEKKLDH